MANTKNYFIKANVRNQSRRDPRGLDLTSDRAGRSVRCRTPNPTTLSATRSFAVAHIDAVIHLYDTAGDVIETHEHNGDLKDL